MKQTANVFRNKSEEGCTMPITAASIMFFIITVLIYCREVRYQVVFFLVPIAAALFTFHEGIEINLATQRYRQYTSIFFVYIGIWKPIPSIDYITIYNERMHQQVHVSSIATDTTSDSVKVAMVYGQNQQIALGKFELKQEAITLGTRFAEELNTKLLDYTSVKPHWIIE